MPSKNGDRIRLRSFDGTTWAAGIDVTGGGLDVWRPTAAVDGQGRVWVAWAQQVDGDWEIFCRVYTPPGRGAASGSWAEPKRLTAAKGSDFHVVAATDAKGRVWLAWQAFRRDNYEILALAVPERLDMPLPEPLVVSSSPADDWAPAIAADGQGGVFVAWDTYDKGNFDVMLRDVGRAGSPSRSPRRRGSKHAPAWRSTRRTGSGSLTSKAMNNGARISPTRGASRTSDWKRTRGSPCTSIERSS